MGIHLLTSVATSEQVDCVRDFFEGFVREPALGLGESEIGVARMRRLAGKACG